MSKRVLVVMAEGCEDVETVAPVDILTRAGVEITIVSLVPGPVKAAYGMTFIPHKVIGEVSGMYDGLFFPGGRANAKALAAHPKVVLLIHEHNNAGKMVSAICAAPSHVLGEAAGILRGKRATGDPSFNEKLAASGAIVTNEVVTQDAHIITGMGPGAAMPFGLKLAEYLVGREIADSFAEKWQIKR